MNHCNEQTAAVMTKDWASCVKHLVHKDGPHFLEQDHLLAEMIDQFVIHIAEYQMTNRMSRRQSTAMHVFNFSLNQLAGK